ncbi:hypothetical protein [Demequina phytophila]|uniref:hypothetical protein n=1 Tax=Demequina phytophila TaxID=1638981 RepID=UPI0007815376|nr:hypothetical protein [Demequina phytophila]
MLGQIVSGVLAGTAMDGLFGYWTRRGMAADALRLQRKGILRGSIRAVDGRLGKFGDMWLSTDWQVSPGRIHVGSTTVVVESVDRAIRRARLGEFEHPSVEDMVVLTVRGPGPTVEVAMHVDQEDWFRATVAPPAAPPR